MLPKLIHFVFGMAEQVGAGDFGLHHYLCLKSARMLHPGHKLVLWYGHAPTGNRYWDAALRLCEPMQIVPPSEIYGNPLNLHAHKADVVRLQVLEAYGGVYMDLDTIVIRPLDEIFVPDCAMAQEYNPALDKVQGLGNAMILARPRSTFIRRWLDSFEFFHSTGHDVAYAFYGVRVPMLLARQNGADISILPYQHFYRYYCTGYELEAIFVQDSPVDGCYSLHLWDSQAGPRGHIAALSIPGLLDESRTSTYSRIARRYIEGFEREYLA